MSFFPEKQSTDFREYQQAQTEVSETYLKVIFFVMALRLVLFCNSILQGSDWSIITHAAASPLKSLEGIINIHGPLLDCTWNASL